MYKLFLVFLLKKNWERFMNVAPNGDIYVGDYNRVRVIYASMSCFGLDSEDPNVCSGHGSCTDVDQCKCDEGWMSIDCSITHCFGFTSNLPDRVCSGRGMCVQHNKCRCKEGFRGHKCQQSPTYWSVGTSVKDILLIVLAQSYKQAHHRSASSNSNKRTFFIIQVKWWGKNEDRNWW